MRWGEIYGMMMAVAGSRHRYRCHDVELAAKHRSHTSQRNGLFPTNPILHRRTPGVGYMAPRWYVRRTARASRHGRPWSGPKYRWIRPPGMFHLRLAAPGSRAWHAGRNASNSVQDAVYSNNTRRNQNASRHCVWRLRGSRGVCCEVCRKAHIVSHVTIFLFFSWSTT